MKDFFRKNIATIIQVIILILVFIILKCIFINAYIPSSSMENTLMPHDRIIGYKLVQEYHRGDIAIFHYDEKKYYIKRVIGVSGDIIDIKDGQVYVNGIELDESYLKEPMDEPEELHYEVPEDSYFFLGDNRNNSADSREWEYPFREKKDMIAKAQFRYWPLNKIGVIK